MSGCAGPDPIARIDLRGTPCPLNFIRTRLALEKIPVGGILQVDLDAGDPEQMVSEGVRGDGHSFESAALSEGGVRLRIRRG
ncbi:MAG: sulfurtransferase TusA family protein [Cyanobium sp.]